MKVKLRVDQRASLIAGLEAPHSTKVIDIPIANIRPETRATIMPYYDPVKGEFTDNPAIGNRVSQKPLPDARVPNILSDADADDFIAALDDYAKALRRRMVSSYRQ